MHYFCSRCLKKLRQCKYLSSSERDPNKPHQFTAVRSLTVLLSHAFRNLHIPNVSVGHFCIHNVSQLPLFLHSKEAIEHQPKVNTCPSVLRSAHNR